MSAGRLGKFVRGELSAFVSLLLLNFDSLPRAVIHPTLWAWLNAKHNK